VAGGQVFLQRLFHHFLGQNGQVRQKGTHQNHVGHPLVANFFGKFVGGNHRHTDVRAGGGAVDHRGIDNQQTAGLDQGFVLVQRRQVHGNNSRWIAHQRGANFFIGDDDSAVGGTAAHFRTV